MGLVQGGGGGGDIWAPGTGVLCPSCGSSADIIANLFLL